MTISLDELNIPIDETFERISPNTSNYFLQALRGVFGEPVEFTTFAPRDIDVSSIGRLFSTIRDGFIGP